MKLKWKIEPRSTGRYSSFVYRSWPSAYSNDGEVRACIVHSGENHFDQYSPKNAKREDLDLRVRVRIDSSPEMVNKFGKWRWRTLVGSFKTLQQAKLAAQAYFDTQEG